MNHLLRSHAPISDAGWEDLDQEARERLMSALAARKLVDFKGPLGWTYSSTNLGRTTALDTATSSSRGPSCATPIVARRTPTTARWTQQLTGSPERRTSRCSTAGRA